MSKKQQTKQNCGDSSDSDDPRPSCSNKQQRLRNEQKRKRRIVMRIEFDDSNDDASSSSASSTDEHDSNDDRPSCSNAVGRRTNVAVPAKANISGDNRDGVAKNLRRRRIVNYAGKSSSDDNDASSVNETLNRKRTRRGMSTSNKMEDPTSSTTENTKSVECNEDAAGFNSDSSSNELLEKCPICLLTFRAQEIGSPVTCEHIFCANCIDSWSRNVQTCPIDRLVFTKIIVRASYEDRRIVREIAVAPNQIDQDSLFNDEFYAEENEAEEVTHCEICNNTDREEVMLLCDSCDQGYHIDCLSPPLYEIPEGSWYCDNCFDSEDELDDVEEDLKYLYEDITDMGIPEQRLRVREIAQPRILRTLQNERIRAAIMRRRSSRTETTTTTTTRTTTTTSRTRRVRSNSAVTKVSGSKKTGRRRIKRRRRRAAPRTRTFVVEYDLNNYDEKFAIKTSKKIVRRRRCKRRQSRRSTRTAIADNVSSNARVSASKRLAEQMGVKTDPTYSSQLSGNGAGLSLFGSVNDLEYFSDDENDAANEAHVEIGMGTAVQTAVRFATLGSQRNRKALLLGKVQQQQRRPYVPTAAPQQTADVLSSIMDMTNRWNNVSKNLSNVRITTDGKFDLTNVANAQTPMLPKENKINVNEVNEMPAQQRGGGHQNYNSGGGGGGGYNKNWQNNRNNYQNNAGSGGGANRHSTGGGAGGFNSNMIGRGNFNFSSPNFNANLNQNNNSNNFTPFSLRFNERNQRNNQNNNNQQRHSLPFMSRSIDDPQLQASNATIAAHQQHANFAQQAMNFNQPPPTNTARQSMLPPVMPSRDTNLFAGLPPPQQQQQQQQTAPAGILFSGLPPPTMIAAAPPPSIVSVIPPPAHLQIPAPISVMSRGSSVPPPPAPPPGMPNLPWTSSLFQLSSNYRNDEDDSSCPNFSIYSNESLEVAKQNDDKTNQTIGNTAAKEDDDYEDLVQLDDDDEIPMPADNSKVNKIAASELYEPENPTEEMDDDDDDKNNNDDDNDNKIKISKHEQTDNDNKIENKSQNDNEKKAVDDAKNDEDADGDGDEMTTEQHQPNLEELSDNESSFTPKRNADKINRDKRNSRHADNVDNQNETSDLSNEKSNDRHTDLHDEDYDPDNETVSQAVSNDAFSNDFSNDKTNESTEADNSKSTNSTTTPPIRDVAKSVKNRREHSGDSNRKGVLDLYDDSDWEELDIERPKEFKQDARNNEEAQLDEPLASAVINEPDRSYTPCLDEKNDENEDLHDLEQATEATEDGGTPNASPPPAAAATRYAKRKNSRTPPIPKSSTTPKGIAGMETELISDDDEDNVAGGAGKNRRRNDINRRHSSNTPDRDNVEHFKKVSHKQRERNYRMDKQPMQRRNDRRRSTRSRSRSRSIRSRTPAGRRSRSRFRSRTRSPLPPARSGGRMRRRSIRSRSRSRSRSFRSRSRSYNKENRSGRSGFGRREIPSSNRRNQWQPQQQSQQRQQYQQQPQRPKRREMPRYDVRNVIGVQRNTRDRYGRDTTRQVRSRSRSRSRSPSRERRFERRSYSRTPPRSISPQRNRRSSFSISPSPPPPEQSNHMHNYQRHMSPPPQRRFTQNNYNSNQASNNNKRRNNSFRSRSPAPVSARRRSRSLQPAPQIHRRPTRSRSFTPPVHRMNGRKVIRQVQAPTPPTRHLPSISRSRSRTRSRSMSHRRSVSARLKAAAIKMKKNRDHKKKKNRKRLTSLSPTTQDKQTFANKQRDVFDVEKPPTKRKRHHGKSLVNVAPPVEEADWSPSPSPPPVLHPYETAKNISWTPPLGSPIPDNESADMFLSDIMADGKSPATSKKDKRKRQKKKKKLEKQKEARKDKRRIQRTQTPEHTLSKEVFNSGKNILVSVTFNKDREQQALQMQPSTQTTVVTVPATRQDLLTSRRTSTEHSSITTRKKKDKANKRKKLDAKPVAIIDLERSPFQVHQEPADVIVLTDSEGENEHNDRHEHRRERERERIRSASIDRNEIQHALTHAHALNQMSSIHERDDGDATPTMERLDPILEEAYELQLQTGPKTPPEPTIVKFSLPLKKQNKVRNPLHEDIADMLSLDTAPKTDAELPATQMLALSPLQHSHGQQLLSLQEMDMDLPPTQPLMQQLKVGPNTPPDMGPRSPDAYDPFEPTKSPSISPRSPTPPVLEPTQPLMAVETGIDTTATAIPVAVDEQQHLTDSQLPPTQPLVSSTALNTAELVKAIINSNKTNSLQDLSSNKSTESTTANEDSIGTMRDKSEENNLSGIVSSSSITVLANVLLSSSGGSQQTQHIPSISSPTPIVSAAGSKNSQILKLPMPKVVGSVSSSSGASGNMRNGANGVSTANTAAAASAGNEDIFNMNDIESPYSPGSADYEDLFEPPPETARANKRSKRNGASTASAGVYVSNKAEVFDNLFGSSSPPPALRLPSYGPSSTNAARKSKASTSRKSKVKVGKSGEELVKIFDDVPNSAVELQVKDKFLRKLNRQERVVEEVKLVLKPRFNKKQITKEEYKEIMRRAVPKICHSRSGEINPHKIKILIEAYVKKFRAKHKKLNLINTGQVSSAVKCAAYLKKL